MPGENRMTIMRHLGVLSVLAMTAGCLAQEKPASFDDVSSVEKAIRSGGLGADFAERAKKTGNLYIQETANPGIPYRVFTFSDYQAGYTLMAEGHHLVLLCAGFGGGYARDFVIKKENGKEVLTYRFDVGSGVSYELTGRYVLGSGQALWDTWDKIKPRQVNPADAAQRPGR
jgi:hypothetical protein